MSAAVVALAGAVGAVVGWFGVPAASDMLLRRARARADAWWSDSLEAYQAFKRARPDDEPDGSARGSEGALGIWREEACAAALAGTLTNERLRALADVGIKVEGLPSMGFEEERRLRCSFAPRLRHRALCALGAAAGFAGAAALGPDPLAAALLGGCFAVMEVAVVCDMRSRIIPLEACALVGLGGVAFQAATSGLAGVAAGAAFALAVVAGCAAANRLLRARCPGGAVGRGDMRCMGSLALATGAGALCGFAACYALAGATALVGCAAGRLKLRDGMPLAPFLAAWLACGSAASVALG